MGATHQYLIHQDKPLAILAEPTRFLEVFASPDWDWDQAAGRNVLRRKVLCKVSLAQKWQKCAVSKEATPLPNGMAWEYLIH